MCEEQAYADGLEELATQERLSCKGRKSFRARGDRRHALRVECCQISISKQAVGVCMKLVLGFKLHLHKRKG